MSPTEGKPLKSNHLSSAHIIKETKPRWITKQMAEEYDRELFLRISLIETILYTFFLVVITMIAMGMVYPSMFYLSKILKDQFLEREFENENGAFLTFSSIRTAADFWGYLESALFNSFYWDYWYDDEDLPITDEDHHKILYENKLLGVPRLRQLKVHNLTCPIHEYFRKSIYACFGAYSWKNRDTASFGPDNETAWWYYTPEETGSVTYWGWANIYDGGGFYQNLRTKRNDTAEIIKSLKKNLWITRGTRAVFLDFAVYNANLNLFCIVKLVFEFPPTGGVIPTARFHALKLIRYVSLWDTCVFCFECIFFAFIAFYTLEELRELIYMKLKYFRHFWNYVDVTILCLAYTYLYCGIKRYYMVKAKLKDLEDHMDSYPNFEQEAVWQLHHNNIIAVLLFFIYMKIFKYITFNKTMAQLNNTIKNCALDVLGFSIMFFIIFLAYAELGYLLFGSQVENFGSFGTSTFTLLRTILGDFDYMSIDAVDRVLAPFFFLSFIFFVFFILLNMFLAIITDTYAQVKTEIAVAPDEMQMTEYLKRRYYALMKKIGLGKFVKPMKEKKVEYNVTLEEIRGALKKCNFSDLEIEMFFARFNIDPTSEVGTYDVNKILQELEKRSGGSGYDIPESGEPTRLRAPDGTPLVAVDDFIAQREQIYNIEQKLSTVTQRMDLLLHKLDNMSNVRKTRLR